MDRSGVSFNGMVKVVVVGGGIIGLSSAYCLQQKYPGIPITLISEAFSPETTGDGSAGIWMPYLLQQTPSESIARWSKATLEFCLKLWKTGEGGEHGVSLLPLLFVGSQDLSPPEGALGLRNLTRDELRRLNIPTLRIGYSFITYTSEPRKLLPYFLQAFTSAGGKVEERRVTDLESLSLAYDVVVHCSGLGAHQLVPDTSVFPIRGQVLRVKAPTVFHAVINGDEDGRYIIPNQDGVVLGGTHQKDDWSRRQSAEDAEFIITGCTQIMPTLKDAEILESWVGLRPGRPSVRLEMEKRRSRIGKPFTIIHNYGHGGSGVTLFWGCALDVLKLVEECMEGTHPSQLLKCKL